MGARLLRAGGWSLSCCTASGLGTVLSTGGRDGLRGETKRKDKVGTPVACLHYGSPLTSCSVASMAQFPPPRRAYETWPDVDVETVPEIYRKAWALRDNLVKTVEYYVKEGWAKTGRTSLADAGCTPRCCRAGFQATCGRLPTPSPPSRPRFTCRCGRTRRLRRERV